MRFGYRIHHGIRGIHIVVKRHQNNTMSNTSENSTSVCANCGKGEESNEDLKACSACQLVKYCNRECQLAHRPQHKKECKKRAAELHEEALFKQPPPEEDCPICILRLPLLDSGRRYYTCCGKLICSGCAYAPVYDDKGNIVTEKSCPFCRTPNPTNEEAINRANKRVECGDAMAIYDLANNYANGVGHQQDYTKALELYHRAAEFGYAEAYFNVGCSYDCGLGVKQNKKKAMHYYELAAIGGCMMSRHNLGIDEEDAGNMDRSLKHYMIAVRGGVSNAVKGVQRLYSDGYATKDDYSQALESYQAYLGEIKKYQRDEAAAAHDTYKYYE